MIAQVGRTQAAVAILLVWILACGGLAWATISAVQLESVEDRAASAKARDQQFVLALSRLDNRVASMLERERALPYEHFRPYYVPAYPLNPSDLSPLQQPIKLESPLREMPEKPIVLHFQASELEGWSSPELESGADQFMPASAFPAGDRERQATAENWLVALKESYTPFKMQQVLEHYLDFHADVLGLSEKRTARSSDDRRQTESAGEFARRGERLLQIERELGVQCEPEIVALENLQAATQLHHRPTNRSGCVSVSRTRMVPVWLDLTLDDRQQLALVRSMNVETSQYCTLQGVLLDWEGLRKELEAQVAEQFPGAKLTPVRAGTPINETLVRSMMQNLPVRLEIPAMAGAADATISNGLQIGLALAWLTTLLALSAITYGTFKFLGMATRRMQFVAAVTHELRTPLTSFQLYSDLLRDMRDDDGQRRRQYAEILRSESKRLARLVENVLAYSRIESRLPSLQLQEAAPRQILDSVRMVCADACAAAGKQIIIEDKCPPGAQLRTDLQFIEQIMVNLVENACKYSSNAPDPRIWLTAETNPDGSITLEVDDAGQGVPHSERQAVFEPFRRSQSQEIQQIGGIGLGLAMSRYWAQSLGGRLTLRRSSRNGAHYTCFSLNLPTALRAGRENGSPVMAVRPSAEGSSTLA